MLFKVIKYVIIHSCYIFHKKKYFPFLPQHIATIVRFDYISTIFGHLKFASGYSSILFIVVTFIMSFIYEYNLDFI
jgi:hypothetical protein